MSVLSYLRLTSRALAPTDSELASIYRSISTLQDRLDEYFYEDEVSEHFQFGSSTRRTMLSRVADRDSDVDYMVVFDNSDGLRPQTLLDRLRRFAEDRYRTSEVFQSHPTLVLALNHVRFELVPAYRRWFLEDLRIPAPASGFADWISTDPEGHDDRLSRADADAGGDVRAAVRLLKYWNVLNGRVFSSYFLEEHVIGRTFWVMPNLKERFLTTFEELSGWELASQKRDQLERAKEVVRRTKDLENRSYAEYAEEEIAKLLPPL